MKRAAILTLTLTLWLGGCAASSVNDINFQPLGQGEDGALTATSLATSGEDTAAEPKKALHENSSSATQRIADRAARERAAEIAAVSEPGSNAYKIGPLDVLDISVFKVPELSKSLQVSEAGSINYPLIGELRAAGRTASDLEKDLAAKLGRKYLQNPQITVLVKEYNSQRITLEGAIKKPGVYPIQGRMSLLQSIAIGGGMHEMSDETVVIFRQSDGKRSAARFDISEIRTGQANDPQLQAGDVIVAGKSAFKEGVNQVLTALRFTSVFALF